MTEKNCKRNNVIPAFVYRATIALTELNKAWLGLNHMRSFVSKLSNVIGIEMDGSMFSSLIQDEYTNDRPLPIIQPLFASSINIDIWPKRGSCGAFGLLVNSSKPLSTRSIREALHEYFPKAKIHREVCEDYTVKLDD